MGEEPEQAESFEALLIKRRELEQDRNPDISFVDHAVLKDGPKAFKSASHFVIVDRHTGAEHHHVLKIESFSRKAGSWIHDDVRSVTLDDEHEDQIDRLLTFLH